MSLDDKFETSRSRKAGPVDDLAGGLASGGESLAKGVVSGISGIFTKPIEGAKKGGAKGFAKGFAKGKSPHSFAPLRFSCFAALDDAKESDQSQSLDSIFLIF